jgi:hypothetical protein
VTVRQAWVALAAALVLGSVSAYYAARPLEMPEVEPACAYRLPILCAELPPNGAWLERALRAPPNDPGAWREAILLDLPYLVAYGVLFALGAWSLREGSRAAARGAVLAIVIAALCDVVENVGILLALDAPASDTLAWSITASAHTKFVLLGIAGATMFVLRARLATWTPARAAFLLLALPCALGILGPLSPRLVEVGLAGGALVYLLALVRALNVLARRNAVAPR